MPYKKPPAVKELEQLAMAEALAKHPTCPHLASRTFRDDTSNGLTLCITAYLRLRGAFVSRLEIENWLKSSRHSASEEIEKQAYNSVSFNKGRMAL